MLPFVILFSCVAHFAFASLHLLHFAWVWMQFSGLRHGSWILDSWSNAVEARAQLTSPNEQRQTDGERCDFDAIKGGMSMARPKKRRVTFFWAEFMHHDAADAQRSLEILRSDSRAIGFMQSDCVTPADGSLKVHDVEQDMQKIPMWALRFWHRSPVDLPQTLWFSGSQHLNSWGTFACPCFFFNSLLVRTVEVAGPSIGFA